MTIKAVDGFNLLSSIGFKDLMGVGVTGMKSLAVLMQSCLDLLELCLAPFAAHHCIAGKVAKYS